jgi:hypothetical protein
VSEGDDGNEIVLDLTFASPAQAIPVADRLSDEGWDVSMHVVLEARASGSSEHLQALHDRLKEIGPELGLGENKSLTDHTGW